MKIRKPADMVRILNKKGFVAIPSKKKNHHIFYYLTIDGVTTDIYTYFSHGKNSSDYGKNLMAEIKRQLRFDSATDCDNFFDCTLSKENYITKLRNKGEV